MLDGLLGRNFSSKCKSLIKPTRTRIEVLRKRAEAKQRFLKEDLAKLLANGLDINAYGRALTFLENVFFLCEDMKQTEEFLAGLSLLSCYDYIDKSCEYIMKQLSSMQKQREFPEECREVMASLMFAAARFSDFPELRDLRDIIQERYGNSLECFANQKFVEKLATKPPSIEKKLLLLQDIASEFSIKWDSRGFEKRMAAPPVLAQDPPKKYGSSRVPEDGNKMSKVDKQDVLSEVESKPVNDGHFILTGKEDNVLRRGESNLQLFGRQEFTGIEHKPISSKDETILKADNPSHRGRWEFIADKHGLLNEIHDIPVKTVRSGSSSRGKKMECADGGFRQHNNGVNIVSKEENDDHFSRGSLNKKDDGDVKIVRSGRSSRSKKTEHIDGGSILHNANVNIVSDGKSLDPSSQGKSRAAAPYAGLSVRNDGGDASSVINDLASHQNNVTLTRKVDEKDADRSRSYYCSPLPPPYVKSKANAIPPPYVKSKDDAISPRYIKPKDGKNEGSRGSSHAGSDCDGHLVDTSPRRKSKAVEISERTHEVDHHRQEGQGLKPPSVDGHCREKDRRYPDDIPLPRPRSMRRKPSSHSKSSSNHDDGGKSEDAGLPKRSSISRREHPSSSHDDVCKSEDVRLPKRSSSSRRREHSGKGLQILFDDEPHHKDEEERMIDKLLLHYSKKPSSYDEGQLRKRSQPLASHKMTAEADYSYSQSRDRHGVKLEMVPSTSRSISLPREQTAPSEPTKVFTRANSFQPGNQARHVHPNLPDYDDLAARFAALRGR